MKKSCKNRKDASEDRRTAGPFAVVAGGQRMTEMRRAYTQKERNSAFSEKIYRKKIEIRRQNMVDYEDESVHFEESGWTVEEDQ